MRYILTIIIVAWCIASGAEDSLHTEWLFENSFEKEYIHINEAVTVLPDELAAAYAFYKNGSYRRAADILFQIRRLNLPDGNLDFTAFMLAECYRKLDLAARADEEYRFVATRFPVSDKRIPSLFRMLEYMARAGDIDGADSIREIFTGKLKQHPLYNSVLYISAKLYFQQEFYEEAVAILDDIPESSIRYIQARFLSALCFVQVQDWEKALAILDKVIKRTSDIDMRTEAIIVCGDIHFKNNQIEKAMESYRKVQKKALRFEYASVKVARCLLDLGKFEKAAAVSEKFISTNAGSEYFFEMASILEQAYESMRKKDMASAVGEKIHRQIITTRITFELYDEIDRLTDIIKQYDLKEQNALVHRDSITVARAFKGKQHAIDLKRRLQLLLGELDRPEVAKAVKNVPHLAERRYLALLKKDMKRMEDTITSLRDEERKYERPVGTAPSDSVTPGYIDTLHNRLSLLEEQYRESGHEHELVVEVCLGGDAEEKRVSEEMQVKFIDWEFIKYLERKENLVGLLKKKIGSEDSAKSDSASAPDSTIPIADSEDLATQIQQLEVTIIAERERLINHIETMLDIFPKSRYASGALFRLAELHNDREGEVYQVKLAAYEKMLLQNSDTAQMDFPEYDLGAALSAYSRVYGEFPLDRYADDALYYAALALKKQGMEDSAQAVLISLIETYPQSEYYVEANMSIGNYYFEHAKKYKDGYKLAEESFRRVLFYRDHPQFVQALYHLGWCYYMQDRFEEAIASFKYMIEQVDLEFDPFAKDDKDVANPLLRSEAVDYLAISFDQDRNIDDAIEFFKLIGSEDYAALVLSRMGELREEDLDFEGAVATYRILLDKYPQSLSAPEATIRLIKLTTNNNKTAEAAAECDFFIQTFGPGSAWQQRVISRDTALVVKIDSMVIAIGLGVADNAYREAQKTGSYDMYRTAADQYERIVEKYPTHPGSADAAWNLAALLEDKLGDKPAAYARFILFSKYPGVDSTRRENAALNAIAIAQSLLLPDSAVQKGAVDFASDKLIAAVNNYTEQFTQGESTAKVLFAMAGVYFNRNLFSKAAEVYQQIIGAKVSAQERVEAMLLLGQCRFGEEKWSAAAEIFDKVRTEAEVTEVVRDKAYSLLLQSLFLDAKEIMGKGAYENAAVAFKKIDTRFPGCAYGDAALFNAAESYEKIEAWTKASDLYFDLFKGYPSSNLAPEGLFNAAGNYEKAEKFNKAAETYQTLISRYPDNVKAKDALFNLGFCFEKLGKLDEMTEANERYSMLYPEEKDVEALLMRSASYYVKTGMNDKAITLFRNFIRRFPQSVNAPEAYFQIGKCQYDQGDKLNAKLSFDQAQQHNARTVEAGGVSNDYFASEAALYHGIILQEECAAIKLHQPESEMNELLKEKTRLLTSAVQDFQRVMHYRSEKMFEAGYRMGAMYEEIADALASQELPGYDPIKDAILENTYLTSASVMVRNAFLPFRKVIELAGGLDSLTQTQKTWVDKAKNSLENDLILAGTYMYDGVGAMQKAPVPKEILSQLLLNFQYKIKLLETLEPLKQNVLGYFVQLLDSLPAMHLDDSLTIVAEINAARLYYLIGSAYDNLSIDILNSTTDLPKDLEESEREDLVFQLEDIVYELQDKALMHLENARRALLDRKLDKSDWFNKVMETLARLEPDKYGKSFFVSKKYTTDTSWICRSDSSTGWKGTTPPDSGWHAVDLFATSKIRPDGAPFVVLDSLAKNSWFWKNIFVAGKPRNARVSVSAQGRYRFFVNEVLTLSDTVGTGVRVAYDSLNNIETLLKSGDNILACEVATDTLTAALSVSMHVMFDSTEHVTTVVKTPAVPKKQRAESVAVTKPDTLPKIVTSQSVKEKPVKKSKSKEPVLTRKQVLEETLVYRQRERKALAELRRQRLEIQKLRIMKSYRDKK